MSLSTQWLNHRMKFISKFLLKSIVMALLISTKSLGWSRWVSFRMITRRFSVRARVITDCLVNLLLNLAHTPLLWREGSNRNNISVSILCCQKYARKVNLTTPCLSLLTAILWNATLLMSTKQAIWYTWAPSQAFNF